MSADFQLVWSRDLHQIADAKTFLAAPALLVQERTSKLVRLHPETGNAMWEAQTREPWGWLAASETRVFYLSEGKRLQCFDVANGRQKWDIVLPFDTERHSSTYGNPVPAGKYLLIGGWRRYTHIRCLNEAGETVWVYPHAHDYAAAIPGPWGLALPCTRAALREVAVIDLDTGEVKARLPLPRGVDQSDQGSSVLRYGEALLATTRHGAIYILDPARSKDWVQTAWHEGGIMSLPVTLARDSVVFLDRSGMICSLRLATGELSWQIPAHHPNSAPVPAVHLAGHGTLVGTFYGRLLLMGKDGEERAKVTVAPRIMSTIGEVTPGVAAFQTKGNVVAFRVV